MKEVICIACAGKGRVPCVVVGGMQEDVEDDVRVVSIAPVETTLCMVCGGRGRVIEEWGVGNDVGGT